MIKSVVNHVYLDKKSNTSEIFSVSIVKETKRI